MIFDPLLVNNQYSSEYSTRKDTNIKSFLTFILCDTLKRNKNNLFVLISNHQGFGVFFVFVENFIKYIAWSNLWMYVSLVFERLKFLETLSLSFGWHLALLMTAAFFSSYFFLFMSAFLCLSNHEMYISSASDTWEVRLCFLTGRKK